MKNVQYTGHADRVTVGGTTWSGHGDVQAVADDDAEKLVKADAGRFRLSGGPTPQDGAESGAQERTASAQDKPKPKTKTKAGKGSRK
jgi:hypothetical protein